MNNRVHHDEWVAMIIAKVSGELSPAERTKLHLHLRSCPQCAQKAGELQYVAAQLSTLKDDTTQRQRPLLPPSALKFKQEVAQRVAQEKQQELQKEVESMIDEGFSTSYGKRKKGLGWEMMPPRFTLGSMKILRWEVMSLSLLTLLGLGVCLFILVCQDGMTVAVIPLSIVWMVLLLGLVVLPGYIYIRRLVCLIPRLRGFSKGKGSKDKKQLLDYSSKA